MIRNRRAGRCLVGVVMMAVLAVCGVWFGMLDSQEVYAEDVPSYRINISPTHINLDLTPGKTVSTKFKIHNTGTNDFDYEINVAPYSVEGDDYRQNISRETSYTDLANWVTVDKKTGRLKVDEETDIVVTVKVPADVPAGGQYAAVLAKMIEDKGDESTGVTMEKQVGTILYATVDGTTRKEGKILENKVPSFMFAPPVQATSVVENTGNVHAEANYILQVFPLFGGEEIYTNEEHPETRVILPETRRLNTVSWDGAPQLGIFRVKQTVKFFDQTSVTEKIVFICPLWFLFIVLAIIFLAIFWIVSRVRGRGKEE